MMMIRRCFLISRAYDPLAFKAWASREACPGIPPVLGLFTALLDRGFKVFLLSGRDEETLGPCTAGNLEAEGFSGYERLIMRYEHAGSFHCPSVQNFGTVGASVMWTAEHSEIHCQIGKGRPVLLLRANQSRSLIPKLPSFGFLFFNLRQKFAPFFLRSKWHDS